MLRVALPNKGQLSDPAREMLREAGYPAAHGARELVVQDPDNDVEFFFLRPRDIAIYVASGQLDIGITGRDWVEETASDIVSLGELRYSKATALPIKVVVAVAGDSPVQRIEDLPHGLRVSTEYPELTRRFFAERGIKFWNAEVRRATSNAIDIQHFPAEQLGKEIDHP